jgi:hypothetical protein
MNITQKYIDNVYVIDPDNFYLVQIIAENKNCWNENRTGEIYVAFKYEFSFCYLCFPQVLTDVRDNGNGVPVIQVKSTLNDETDQIVEPFGKILESNLALQRPVNWADYVAIKESNPGKISLDYVRAYNNSLYNKGATMKIQ